MLQRYKRSKSMISKGQRSGLGGGRSDDTRLSDGGDLRRLPNVYAVHLPASRRDQALVL